jgi:hypothetical protein
MGGTLGDRRDFPGGCAPTQSGQTVDLGGQHKITLGKPVDLVGPYRDLDLAPAQAQIRVVALFLGEFAGYGW